MPHFGIQYEDNTILNLVSYLYFYTNMLFSVPFNSYSISERKEILYQNFSLIHFYAS